MWATPFAMKSIVHTWPPCKNPTAARRSEVRKKGEAQRGGAVSSRALR